MKKEKLFINSNQILKSSELLTLKGGTETMTTFFCKHGAEIIGCIWLYTCEPDIAERYCKTLPEFDTMVYSCGVYIPC